GSRGRRGGAPRPRGGGGACRRAAPARAREQAWRLRRGALPVGGARRGHRGRRPHAAAVRGGGLMTQQGLNLYACEYGCAAMDPPWPERGGGKSKRGADRHYPLLGVPQIVELVRTSEPM